MSEYGRTESGNCRSFLVFGDFTEQEIAVFSDWTHHDRKGVEFFLPSGDNDTLRQTTLLVPVENTTRGKHEISEFCQSSDVQSGGVDNGNADCNRKRDTFDMVTEGEPLDTHVKDTDAVILKSQEEDQVNPSVTVDCDLLSMKRPDQLDSHVKIAQDSIVLSGGKIKSDGERQFKASVAGTCVNTQPDNAGHKDRPILQAKEAPLCWADLFKKKEPTSSSLPCMEHEPKVPVKKTMKKICNEVHFAHKHLQSSTQFIPIEKDVRLNRLVSFVKHFSFVEKREPYVIRGLVNQGNWCYINATLQVLLGVAPFYDLFRSADIFIDNSIEKSAIPLIDCMVLFVNKFREWDSTLGTSSNKNQSHKQYGSSFEPKEVYDVLPLLKSSLSEKGRQEDAEEFLSFLLNGLHDEFSAIVSAFGDTEDEVEKPEDTVNGDFDTEAEEDWEQVGPRNKSSVMRHTKCKSSIVRSVFGGTIRSSVHQSGVKESATLQPFFTLQLDIQSEEITDVKEALELYFTRKNLQGFTCSKTNEEVEAFHKTSLEKLPWILILHLKYFVFDKTGGSQKLHKAISIHPELEIPRDVLSPAIKGKIPPQDRLYKLLGVVYHHGKHSAGGHYTAAVNQGNNGWVLCDDSIIESVSVSSVITHHQDRVPYLLLYERMLRK